MNWPFVSRKRFERVQELKRKYRAEIARLNQIIATDKAVIESGERVIESLSRPSATKEVVGQIGVRPTLEFITAAANRAAEQRSRTGGTAISKELQEAAMKGRRDAKHG